jgi:cytochrome c peroxidase
VAGGRTIASGPNAGVGRTNPYKSGLVSGFTLSTQERADLLALLRSLTDSTFLTDPRFGNPWPIGSAGNP